jgi:hypothetical protein
MSMHRILHGFLCAAGAGTSGGGTGGASGGGPFPGMIHCLKLSRIVLDILPCVLCIVVCGDVWCQGQSGTRAEYIEYCVVKGQFAEWYECSVRIM